MIDTATPQRNLNWGSAFAEGWTRVYIKLGGTNVLPQYVSPYYRQQVDSAISVGMRNIGHYWVPNARYSSPVEQADFMVNNLHRWDKSTHFIVLDNETLDDGLRFSDAQAAAFINRIKERLGITGAQAMTYSGLNDARNTSWPAVLATGSNFIIAAYSYPPMQLPSIPTIPADRIVGHQFGGKSIGGVVTDTNSFTDNAFNFGTSGGSMYNPYANWRITGTWEDHASYSAGGTDYPLPNGTTLYAPASGTLRISGGSGEFAAGFVGSAGRRSILELDQPVNRRLPKKASPPEGDGPMVAVVMQHQSAFGTPGWKPTGGPVGVSGNSDGTAGGGDYHLHIHGLNARGQRLRFESFVDSSSTGGGGGTIPIQENYEMAIMILAVDDRKGRPWRILDAGYDRIVPDTHVDVMKGAVAKVLEVNSAQYDIICANYLQGESFKVNPAFAKSQDPAVLVEAINKAIDAALKDATVSSEVTDADKKEIAELTVANFVEQVIFATKK